MHAANDDAEHDLAWMAFVNARPTTLAGVIAKLEASWRIVESARDGDTVTEFGWDEATAFFRAAVGTLGQFKARTA
ncbi:MAG: hypothetical protein Q8M26_05260 [Pseudolabrys sp.]|nr:hypothetical protein [Pseudolabrys sp.]